MFIAPTGLGGATVRFALSVVWGSISSSFLHGKFLEMGEWYLHVHDITDPEFADCMSSSDSDSSAPDYEHEELDEDYIAPKRTQSVASPHLQSCDAQRDP